MICVFKLTLNTLRLLIQIQNPVLNLRDIMSCVKGTQKENFIFRLSSLVTWKGKLALTQPKLFPKPCELIFTPELWLMFSPRRCLFCTKGLLLPFLRAKTCTFLQTKTTKRDLTWNNFAFPSAIL